MKKNEISTFFDALPSGSHLKTVLAHFLSHNQIQGLADHADIKPFFFIDTVNDSAVVDGFNIGESIRSNDDIQDFFARWILPFYQNTLTINFAHVLTVKKADRLILDRYIFDVNDLKDAIDAETSFVFTNFYLLEGAGTTDPFFSVKAQKIMRAHRILGPLIERKEEKQRHLAAEKISEETIDKVVELLMAVNNRMSETRQTEAERLDHSAFAVAGFLAYKAGLSADAQSFLGRYCIN